MSPSLLSTSLIERLKLISALISVPSRSGNSPRSRAAKQEAVKVLEAKVREKPREWFFWYALGDWYIDLDDYAKAVHACEKCYELRPRDPRSAYSLATTLHVLTRAKYLGYPKVKEFQESFKELLESGMSSHDIFCLLKSQQGLKELGLTINQAAEKSLTLFEEVITLGVSGSEAKMVEDTLAVMYAEFPYLESKVKSSRKPSTRLFAEARGDPFNEAVDHYQKLRYVILMKEPAKYQAELIEIIRLCQLGIARQRRNGDAYVLLANAYYLAALHTLSEGYKYCLPRAAAVIYEWKSNHPPTTNRELGEQVYQGILERLQRPFPDWWMNMSLKGSMSDTHREYYHKAINPNIIPELKQLLSSA
jgi:tetratricopeptide (TPR) repeat protein